MAASSTTEHRGPTELVGGGCLWGVAFSRNGEYLVSGDSEGVQVWRVEDGTQVARMQEPRNIRSVAMSNENKWIAAGGWMGHLYLWDAQTQELVISHRANGHLPTIHGIDFSPDGTRLVVASQWGKVTIWDVPSRKQIQTFYHEGPVLAARYSPQGHIATATSDGPIRLYDDDGHLLMEINTRVVPVYNTGLVWFNDHLLVVSDGKISQIEPATRSTVSEWSVPDVNDDSCIALQKHGKFVAYSAQRTVTFWDTSSHAQIGLVECPNDIRSIAISPTTHLMAIGRMDNRIVIKSLSGISASTREQGRQDEQSSVSKSHDTNSRDSTLPEDPPATDSFTQSMLREPDWKIDNAVCELWMHDQLTDAEALLTAAISASQHISHYLLVNRSLVRARLEEWDAALADAEMAFEMQQSVLGYVAKSRALVGKGERDKGYLTCDIACAPYPSHVCFLRLIKAVTVFISGDHPDGISHIDDIIMTVPVDPTYSIVQAYMYLLVGNSYMEHRDYERAIESFRHARARMRAEQNRSLLIISLISGWKFGRLSAMIQRGLCEALYATDHTEDAIECLNQTTSAPGGDEEHLEWLLDFKRRLSDRLVSLGDTAADAKQHNEAIAHYSHALSLGLPSIQDILIKRGKVLVAIGAWQRTLDDAENMIALDPSSPWGYQIKHTALHQAQQFDGAIHAFKVMLSKFAESPDSEMKQHGDRYVDPETTRAAIRKIVQRTIRRSPRVEIDTMTGRLQDRAQRGSLFESLPIFNELVSSMTTRIDYVRIKREVRQYFRYVMFSHRWDADEPPFQRVMQTAVYELEQSPTHDKLQTFCRIARDAGIKWAWSDTCCIEKSDHIVLQEALVAMFKWYEGAVLTIVFLRGVHSWSQLGALVRSIWNKRGWTLQEYIASKVVHFYTEDWTLYLDLQLPNHKECSEVISEMEEATGVSAEQLRAIQPGLSSIREKLRLASPRETTHQEDVAYSLLGIFSVNGLSAIYGEGNASLGRLLAHLLTGSGDVSILAWTGASGKFNSALPAYITVFSGPATSHLPLSIPDAEMARVIDTSPPFDLDVALSLYDRLSGLPAPWFATSRMKLPCIAFILPPLSYHRSGSDRFYRADTPVFGTVEIRTRHNLPRMTLYLVHPWLDALLEPGHAVIDGDTPPPSPDDDEEDIHDVDPDVDDHAAPPSPDEDVDVDVPLGRQPGSAHQSLHMDDETRARRFVARLRQPFGALLVTPTGGRRATPDYRRVAPDCLIMVRIQENVSLASILDDVQTLDVL